MTVQSDMRREQSAAVVERAWHSFVGGADQVSGVPSTIVRSWFRCREQYRVDPSLREAPCAPGGTDRSSFVDDAVFVELGGSAMSVMHELADMGSVVSVADRSGRVLAAWGDHATVDRGQASNLAPLAHWAEGASGTNGIGTALASTGPVVVRGPEHWCQGFHNWVEAGVAVRDAVTEEPAAVLSVARWKDDLPDAVVGWLVEAISGAEARLREHAMDSARDLIAAFEVVGPRPRGGLLAIDRAGRVVLADEQAGIYLDVPSCTPAVHPKARRDVGLSSVAAMVSERVRDDRSWVGGSTIPTQVTDEPIPVQIMPVLAGRRHVGSIISFGDASSEPNVSEPDVLEQRKASECRAGYTARIVAARGDRSVFLRPTEVCYAEADGNDVWLATDRGRLQAATYSLDRLEEQFQSSGFLRVHRRFMVNLNRVREAERGFKGELFLTLDNRANDSVPVSRRNAAMVRRVLGL